MTEQAKQTAVPAPVTAPAADDTAKFTERITAQDAEIARLKHAGRVRGEAAFVEGLVREGKVTPALRDRGLAAFMAGLDDQAVVTFAEEVKDGDKVTKPAVKATQAAHFRELLSALPVAVSFGEVAPATGDRGTAQTDPEAIAAAAVEFQETERKAGRTVSATVAVAHVMKGGK